MSGGSQNVLRVGIVGVANEHSQLCRLPSLLGLPQLYKVVAIYDPSPSAVTHCNDKDGPFQACATLEELVDAEVDVVMILSDPPWHVEAAVLAAKAGKDVFIEKPMALTAAECDTIISAVKYSNVRCQVGLMRRCSPSFVQAVEEIKAMGPIVFARVRDIIGPNDFFIAQGGQKMTTFSDVPESSSAHEKSWREDMFAAALGEYAGDAQLRACYSLLGGLGCHDLSTMREALGMPLRCLGATYHNGTKPFINALFDYGTFTVSYETGCIDVPRFDAHLEVYSADKVVRINWDTPYCRSLPEVLTLQGTDTRGQYYENVARGTFVDQYTAELVAFHASLTTEGTPIKSTPEDAKLDVAVFDMIVDRLVLNHEKTTM